VVVHHDVSSWIIRHAAEFLGDVCEESLFLASLEKTFDVGGDDDDDAASDVISMLFEINRPGVADVADIHGIRATE